VTLHDAEMRFVSIISDWLQQSVRNDASEENKYCVVIVIQQLHYNLIRMRDWMTTVTIF
jgi:hypothetical protein